MKLDYSKKNSRRATSAFTLIELLIVIVIIAILAAVAFPVTAMVMESARKTEAKYQAKGIKSAIAAYRMEYGKLPFEQGGGGGNIETDTVSDDLIAMLSGVEGFDLNPKETTFYEGKQAKGEDGEKIGGIYGRGDGIRLVDPWGYPYYIVLDGDYDDLLEGFEATEGEELRQSIAVYSKGKPDKDDVFKEPRKWLKSWQ